MFGKLVLPLLGGAPAVWNTCLVFFQVALLMGYVYAHAVAGWMGFRLGSIVHSVLLGLFLVFLPLGLPPAWNPPIDSNPVPELLMMLASSVGVPFVALSACAPLLQDWYSKSGCTEPSPYFLYAVSNAGSFAGLLGYPLVVEPCLTLKEQVWGWSLGYAAVFLLIASAAVITRPGTRGPDLVPGPSSAAGSPINRFRLLVLAAVPVALLQSMTTFITTDIAAVPLLWVAPLAVYLLSFVLVFSGVHPIPQNKQVKLQSGALICVVVWAFWVKSSWLALPAVFNLFALFVTAMLCHGELSRLRPGADRLTEFYVWLSLGGILGGVFAGIVSPLLFHGVMEYPLSLVLAALVRPHEKSGTGPRSRHSLDILLPLLLLLALTVGIRHLRWLLETAYGSSSILFLVIPASIAVYLAAGRPVRFALGLGALVIAGHLSGVLDGNLRGDTLFADRNFFGVMKVQVDRRVDAVTFSHGTALHGSQYRSPARKREPTCYHSLTGPLGDVFAYVPAMPEGRRVAVAGLGAGTMACYADARDHWVFYEIDPAVVGIAQNYFSFLADSPSETRIVPGDARLSLRKASDAYFHMIVLDAFSSDSIPVHLLTREAFDLYLQKLAPSGVLVVNITNRHLELDGLLGNLAKSLNVRGVIRSDSFSDTRGKSSVTCSSTWAVLARDAKVLVPFQEDSRWRELSGRAGVRTWTDDFSNLVQFLKISP